MPASYASLVAIECEKLLVNDKITASCQIKRSPMQALYQTLQTTKIDSEKLLG